MIQIEPSIMNLIKLSVFFTELYSRPVPEKIPNKTGIVTPGFRRPLFCKRLGEQTK